MDLDVLLDNYKSTDLKKRLIFCVFIGIFPSLYNWLNDYDNLQIEKDSAVERVDRSRLKFNKNKKKVADLKDLESKVNIIETGLEKARTLLPEKIEMDQILASIGQMETDFNVKILSFTPSDKIESNKSLGYAKHPVKMNLKGDFAQTMMLLDKLVHMDSLTHLRNISFRSNSDNSSQSDMQSANTNASGVVLSSVDLIIYKGN